MDDYVDNLYRSSVLVKKDKVLSILSSDQSIKNDPAMMFSNIQILFISLVSDRV